MTFAENLPAEENAIKVLVLKFHIQISCKTHMNYLVHKQISICFQKDYLV